MPQYVFTLSEQGGLGMQSGTHLSLYLWPDEVAKLRRLLGRPTPATNRIELLSRSAGVQVRAWLSNTDQLRFMVDGTDDVAGRFTLEQAGTMELRRVLGLLEPRDPEPDLVVWYASSETWGPRGERADEIAARAAHACSLAEARRTRSDV